jgi:carbon monoxide dehydrogenase subunit G
MTTIRKNIEVNVPAAKVWDVVRDIGAVHTRFAPGFVIDTRLEGGSRLVTFANGLTIRERIVDINEDLHRLAYSASGETIPHHNASFEVLPLSSDRTRLVWTTDVLPDAAAEAVRPLIEQGSVVIQAALNKA